MDDVRAVVVTMASEILEVEPDVLTDDCVVDELGVSSIVRFDFTVALERRFSIEFGGKRMFDARTMGDIVSLVKELMTERAA